jgi:dihydropteroate synthase
VSPLRVAVNRAKQHGTVLFMGVLNTTPDSFSDGGLYLDPPAAKQRVDELLAAGAEVIDIGGESTRPAAPPIAPAEQIARIRHALVYAAKERRALVSVDTTNAEVAAFAVANGASAINDVSCLADDELAAIAADSGAALIVMHARGSMSDMRGFSDAPGDAYDDVVSDVMREWSAARSRANRRGMDSAEIFFDPGLGYMKNAAHSIELIARLDEFAPLDAPVVVGPSRKSFIAKTVSPEAPPGARLGGTIAACLACAERGAAILRVHDVFEVKQAVDLSRAILGTDAVGVRLRRQRA